MEGFMSKETFNYSCPLIKYSSILKKWSSVCPTALNIRHTSPPKSRDIEQKYFEAKYSYLPKSEPLSPKKEDDLGEGKLSELKLEKALNTSDIIDQEFDKSTNPNTSETNSVKGEDDTRAIDLSTASHHLFSKSNLKFLTYNIWFNEYNWKVRTQEILNICEKKDPDVICLQEVTETFMTQLMGSQFIQTHFYITNIPFQLRNWYDVVILSKYSCQAYIIPFLSRMSRKLLYITFYNKENEMIKVGTTHLESKNSNYTREAQLNLSYRILDNPETTGGPKSKYNFLLGDFNLTEKDDYLIKSAGYTDQGQVMINKTGSKEEWFTMKSMKGYPGWRPDRFTFKVNSEAFSVKKFEIVGKEPLIKETFFNPVGTPSDHYGIYAECSL